MCDPDPRRTDPHTRPPYRNPALQQPATNSHETAAAAQEELSRWGVVWHYALLQSVEHAKTLHPDAVLLLDEKERQLYTSAQKGQQLIAAKVQLLVAQANLPNWQVRIMALV
jgi:hypothetical protein